jgi:hypothetical protein
MRSTVRWNLNPDSVARSSSPVQRALQLAARDATELDRLMKCCEPPEPCSLIGTWYGINKGVGAAAIGLHQDVKVFESCRDQIVGHNILVEQVAVEEIARCGWQPKRAFRDGQPKTIGNFVVTHERDERSGQQKLILDYNLAENPMLDPTRYLIDELVEVSPNLMLGRARVRVGLVDTPVAYFVLTRFTQGDEAGYHVHEEELSCDSPSSF